MLKYFFICEIVCNIAYQFKQLKNNIMKKVTVKTVQKKEEDHAILIADAGNTYQETNKLPSELAEANKELLNLLTHIRDASHIQITGFEWTEIDELIKKHSHA